MTCRVNKLLAYHHARMDGLQSA